MMSSRKRQAVLRKRDAALGRSELRGIIATKEEQAILKSKIKLILCELRKKDDQSTGFLNIEQDQEKIIEDHKECK